MIALPALRYGDMTIPPARAINAAAAQRGVAAAAERSVVPLVYGEDRIKALIVNVLPADASSSTLLVQCLWGFACDAVSEVLLNDKALPAGATVTHYTGAQVTPHAALATAFAAQSITYADALTGYAYTVLAMPTSAFDGQLDVSAKVRGRKVYDVRKDSTAGGSGAHRLATPSTWEWSDNPALALADFCRDTNYGLARTVDWSTVHAAANACDALVGSPAEKRRLIGVSFTQATAASDIADALRAYAGCFLLPGAAGLKLIADADAAAVASYSHADGTIAGIGDLQRRDIGNVPTAIEVAYTDTSAVPWREAAATASLAGAGSTRPWRLSQVKLPGIQRYSQAYREAQERLDKLSVADLSCTLEVFDLGIRHEEGDIVTVTHPIGLSALAMRIVGLEMPAPGRWRLRLVQHNAGAYSTSTPSAPTLAAPGLTSPVGPPANVQGLTGAAGDGIITWSWTGATERGYAETQLRLGGTDWDTAAPLWSGRGTAFVHQVAVAGSYTVRAKHVLTDGQASAAAATASATVTSVSSFDFADLSGHLQSSQLAQELAERIDLIDAPGTGLVDRIDDLETTYGETQSAAASAAAASTSAAEAAAAQAAALLAQSGAEVARDTAEIYKTNASTSATNAATSATTASTAATGASGSASSASTSAINAANSASAAAGSASAASDSASSASTYATSSENAATASQSAKVAAESARDAAAGSATAAASSASTATTKATEAGQSANSANTSATNAATSAGAASTSASQASTSATNANGSAQQAATSLLALRAIATGFEAAYAWNFDSTAEGWTAQGGSATQGGGALDLQSSGNDPILVSPTIALTGGTYTTIRVRLMRTAGSGWEGGCYFATAGHSFTPPHYGQTPADPTALNQWRVLEIEMGAAGDWMSSVVTQIRLDLGTTPTDRFLIDWVAVGRAAPQAYGAMIAAEATARASADSAMASQITTLSSTVGGHTTSLQTQQQSIDGVRGIYSVKIDNNGVLSGFGLMSTLAANGSVTSDFFIRAGTFAVIAPAKVQGEADSVPFAVLGAPRTINGVSFQAGVHIHGSAIINGTLTAGKIDTKGLTIKDANGNVIFGSGASVDPSSFISAPSGWQNDSASIGGSNFAPNTSFDRWAGTRPYQWGVYETAGGSVSLTQGLGGGLFGASYVRCTTNQYISAGYAFGTLTRLLIVPDPGSGIQSWVPGQTYVISFWGRSNGGGMVGQKLTGLPSNMGFASSTTLEQPALTTSWQRYSWRVVPNDNSHTPYGELFIGWHEVSGAVAGASFDVCCVKVELGRVPTAWGASDRDMRNSSASLGVNILYNGDFSNGKDGWTYGTPSGVTEASNGVNLSSDWRLQPSDTAGADVFYSRQAARAGNNNYYLEWLAPPAAVVAGERYVASAYTGAHRASVEVFVYCYNTSGTAFQAIQGSAVTAMNQAEATGGQALSGYKRIFVAFTAPAGTSYIRVVLRKYDTYANNPAHEDSYMFVARVMLEQAGGAADAPGPWASAGYTDRTAVRAGNPVTANNVSTYIEAAAIGSLDISTTGKVRSGKTSYGSGTGWLIEYNGGTPRLDIGSSTQYLRWTGSELQVKLNTVSLTASTPGGGTFSKSSSATPSLGSCTVEASGGTTPYSWSWTYTYEVDAAVSDVNNFGGASFSSNVANLYARGATDCIVSVTVTCVVTDANGLTATISRTAAGTFGNPS